MIKLPGISLTLGMTQGDHKPYARVRGRSGMFSASKNIDLSNGAGLIAAVGTLLVANAVKKTKKPAAKKKVSAATPQELFKF